VVRLPGQRPAVDVFESVDMLARWAHLDAFEGPGGHGEGAEVVRSTQLWWEERRRSTTKMTSSTTSPTTPPAIAPNTAGEVVRARS
jgi:hypothetical protein